MPTNRTQRTRNRTTKSGITEADYQFFTAGDWFEAQNYTVGKTPGELRKFWDAHKWEILERYDAEMRALNRKGDRPWYWWSHEMPEPQLPAPPGKYEANKVWNHQKKSYGWWESDYEYLERLDLLQEWEK